MSESSEIHVKRHIYLSISLATFFAWMIESYSYNCKVVFPPQAYDYILTGIPSPRDKIRE